MASCSDYFSAALRSDNPAQALGSICALDRGSSVTAMSERFGLPHHATPGGPPDRACVGAAMAALMGSRTGTPMSGPGIPEAKAHLMRHERELGMGGMEAAEGITFEVDPEEVGFSVDQPRRMISGLIVPWNKVARSGFARWTFPPGSLRWPSSVSRIKLNTNHDHKQPIGKAIRITSGPAGLDATFQIARTEEGDKALALAADGITDGFSIEVDFDGEEDGWAPDPENQEVRRVDMGRLAGTALTGFPAFDDARVERVAATREGGNMAEKEEVTLDAEEASVAFDTTMERLAQKVADSHAKLTEELSQSIGESISEGVKAALEDISAPQGPTNVRAARYSVNREPPVYAFDGGGFSLVRDAWAAARDRDDDALERIRKYRQQSADLTKIVAERFGGWVNFTPQSTSTASQIIPPGYRPDLYVPDVTKLRPTVNLASRGTIQNAAPFSVPVFSSATSVTADHVEGTNPSDGSLAFATKTVTPQGISGRLTLTRELVDSANPAIDQIALAEMRESYARQTEVKVYTLLNGTSGAGGVITADQVPSGAQASTVAAGTDNQTLAAHIRERLAKYPFLRFGEPDGAVMGMAATVKVATALDTTKRPLFPSVNPSNAFGTGRVRAWNIDGLNFYPAWSNTGTAVGDSQILIIDSSALWVWESPLLTFRFEEKQGPANIELNLFGYFGTQLLRPVGLSGIRIT